MDYGKQGSWDSSCDEYDPQDQHRKDDEYDDDNDPTKRPYECTFCKRGFTNAQALGGHMNIHRKDRAKAKGAKHRNFVHSSSSQISPPVSITQPTAVCYPPPLPSYRMYFDTTGAMGGNFPIHQAGSQNRELLGANLSLQIDQNGGVWNSEEVDLELRLGHEYR